MKKLNAQSAVIENEYLDQDFSAEFSRFYSTVFRRFSKVCRRLHFFSEDIGATLRLNDPQKLSDSLQDIGNRSYLGFAVVRPLRHAPLGRTVLVAPISPSDRRSKLLVRASYSVHLLGAELRVEGFPYVQQDSRISSCAQATIWMAGRHFYTKHKGPWFATVDISEAASQPTDTTLAQSLPAGSGGLNTNNMVRALRAMGREPLSYLAKIDNSGAPPKIDWGSKLRPHEIIARYVDSGVPVILGIAPWEIDQTLWHAVVAIGHTTRTLDSQSGLPDHPTRAEFLDAFLVNDDQRGVSLRMPIVASAGDTPYSLENVGYLIVPLPKKVFINAESAERIAWQLVDANFQSIWSQLKAQFAAQIASCVQDGDDFLSKISRGELVARTYLTFGWKYKARILRNCVSDVVKRVASRHEFPKFVWVTEFGSVDALNKLEAKDRLIISHSVIDATSSNYWEAACLFHAPGFVIRWFSDPKNPTGDLTYEVSIVPDNPGYQPKIRGQLTA
ncbi:MAG: hypothetical protein AB7S71_08185 [Dongiaceae bacterium]